MRVLEKGLHNLATELEVHMTTPIEQENWNTIIDKIESKIRSIDGEEKGLIK